MVWDNIGIGLADKIQTGVTESGLPEFLLFLRSNVRALGCSLAGKDLELLG